MSSNMVSEIGFSPHEKYGVSIGTKNPQMEDFFELTMFDSPEGMFCFPWYGLKMFLSPIVVYSWSDLGAVFQTGSLRFQKLINDK